MAATSGMLTQQTSRFDGFISPSNNMKFSDIPNGLGALKAVPLEGWVQIAVLMACTRRSLSSSAQGRLPVISELATLESLSLDDQSAGQLRSLNAEIANGRLAMLGILGMFASEVVNGECLAETKIFG